MGGRVPPNRRSPVISCLWSNPGARFQDVVTRKMTVVLFQPMPGLEEPDRKRLLPVRVWGRQSTFSEADIQTEGLQCSGG